MLTFDFVSRRFSYARVAAGQMRLSHCAAALPSTAIFTALPTLPHWSWADGEGVMAARTASDPVVLRTAPGTSGCTMYRDLDQLMGEVSGTRLTCQLRVFEGLHD